MPLVVGVTDSFHKIVIPIYPPTVLRRTGAATTRAQGIRQIRIGRQPLLEDDAMLPVVAEIVGVFRLGAHPAENSGQRHCVLIAQIRQFHKHVLRGRSEPPLADREFMQVVV